MFRGYSLLCTHKLLLSGPRAIWDGRNWTLVIHMLYLLYYLSIPAFDNNSFSIIIIVKNSNIMTSAQFFSFKPTFSTHQGKSHKDACNLEAVSSQLEEIQGVSRRLLCKLYVLASYLEAREPEKGLSHRIY